MLSPAREHLLAKVATELVGTYILCLTVSLTGSSSTAAIAIGCSLMVCIYAGGHVSGAHYNPAVTLAIWVRGDGKVTYIEAILYAVVQILAAFLAMFTSWGLIGQDATAYPALGHGVKAQHGLCGEFMITFALATVVLNTATTKAQANNSYYGLAIGFTVLSGAISVGPYSGGAFNPAVGTLAMGPLFFGEEGQTDMWIYSVGPLLGGVAAGLLFRITAYKEYPSPPIDADTWALPTTAPGTVEAVGTMMLCFTVALCASPRAPAVTQVFGGLSIGSMLMVMVYAGGAVSGAHYNPAVTLAVTLRTRMGDTHDAFPWSKAGIYVLCQCFGAAFGMFMAYDVMSSNGSSMKQVVGRPAVPRPCANSWDCGDPEYAKAFFGEVIGTFLLAYVVLSVATVKQLAGNSFFGLAIGMTVTACAISIGPVSGGAFNPAVGLLGLADAEESNFWLYWIACPLGGALAAGFFRLQNFEEFKTSLPAPKFMAHAPHEEDVDERFASHAHHFAWKKGRPPQGAVDL